MQKASHAILLQESFWTETQLTDNSEAELREASEQRKNPSCKNTSATAFLSVCVFT